MSLFTDSHTEKEEYLSASYGSVYRDSLELALECCVPILGTDSIQCRYI